MNLKDKHDPEKPVSAAQLFKGEEGTVLALQIKKDQLLKEHITKVPALLLCVSGKVSYEDENGTKVELLPGSFMPIEPMVKHWVNGLEDSQLVLAK